MRLLVEAAAAALADMGVSEPSGRLLEPVARAIHGLAGACGREKNEPGHAPQRTPEAEPKAGPLVSVIVLGWGGEPFVGRCLRSLSRQTYPNLEILVVDNASTDRTAEIVERDFPHVRLIRTQTNLGIAGGNNVGLRAATGDILILTNVDTEARADWVERLVRAMEGDPTIGIATSKLLYPDGTIQFGGGAIDRAQGFPSHLNQHEPDSPGDTEILDVDFATGASLAMRREVLDQIGFEDEAFYPVDYEDPDMCYRARLAGWRVCYVPQAVSVHFESSTLKRLAPHRVLSSLMGRMRFVCKYWTADELRCRFLPAETQWLQALRQSQDGVARFIERAMPLVYAKTLLDLEDLAEWRERLGTEGREASRETLRDVLGRLRAASSAGPGYPVSERQPPDLSAATYRMLERWMAADREPPGSARRPLLHLLLNLYSVQGYVNPVLPIARSKPSPGGLLSRLREALARPWRWAMTRWVGEQTQANAEVLQALSLLTQEVVLALGDSSERERDLSGRVEALEQRLRERDDR